MLVPAACPEKRRVHLPIPCTLANVWCLLKKHPAPRAEGKRTTIRDEEESTLIGDNSIRTSVYEAQCELINVTMPGHILHNPNQPADCPRSLNELGAEQCSQIVRHVIATPDGSIRVRTTGYGYNPYARVNRVMGPVLFGGEDKAITVAREVGPICVNDP